MLKGFSAVEVENDRNCAMKKVFHLCHSSKEEVLFRSHDDYNWGFNCYALALYKTESCSLADAHMSNHRHLVVQTDAPERLMRINRLAYTRHMNTKYKRKGPLGESGYFCVEIEGIYHLLAAISYTLRNPLHHGISPTPFAYPHSAANVIFQSQLGKCSDRELLDKRNHHTHVGRNVKIPQNYHMDKSGLFLRNDVTAVQQVELLYGTPRNFLYYMNRPSDDKWIEEQKEDDVSSAPVTIETIEHGVMLTPYNIMLKNEKGRINYKTLTDIQLCEEVDRIVVTQFKTTSIYCLSYSEKQELYHIVKDLYHAGEAQTRRCLAMDYM